MKTILRRISAAATLLCALFGVHLLAAPPQSVTITTPPNGAQILVAPSSPVTITVNATSSGSSATISTVDFRVNNVSIGTVAGGASSVSVSMPWQPGAVGTYTLTAVASDSSSATGNTLTSNSAVVTVSSVSATSTSVRAASVTAPASGSTFPQNSVVFVRGTASMSDGIVSSLAFILTDSSSATVPLGLASSPPYNRAVTLSQTPGAYTLTAQATASDGLTTFTSAAVPITIAPPIGNGPSATITAPTPSDTIAAGNSVTVFASATDTDGSIVSVTFFADGEQIGATDTTSPYSVTWAPTVVKTYALTALATDNSGNTRLSPPVSVNVLASAPTVSISAPTSGSAGNVGVPQTVSATASATAGTTVTGVEFFAGNTSLGVDTIAPYSIQWTPQNTGSVTLTARATDSNSVSVTSAGVSVNIGVTSPPTVTITAPVGGTSISNGATVSVNATATAATGLSVASVQFSANGTPIGTDSTFPYGISWTPSTTGLTILSATVTDTAGGSAVSSSVSVTVVGANSNLAVTIAASGSTTIPVDSTRLFTATPVTTSGVDRVEFYYDDSLIATDTTAPYSFLFTAPNSIGLHQVKARVVDATGGAAVSANLTINIAGPVGSLPLVGILTPSSNSFLAPATLTTIGGTALDADGSITGVQVIVNGSLLGSATITGNNWSINWTTPTVQGPVSITAIATDNSGNAVAAPAVGVVITDGSAPGILLSLAPGQLANGIATLPSGAIRNIVANVTPSNGRAIVRVEFFVDGTKVGEDTTTPYSFRYLAPALGDGEQSHAYVFSARATDNAGAARDVLQPLLVVAPIGQPPVVNLLTPTNGASGFPGTAVSLAATAVANGGNITSVQFFVNGSPASVNSGNAIVAAPYTSTFMPTAPGSYTIDAIATDDRGNTAVSGSATIMAAFATPTIVFASPNPNGVARATPGVPLTLTANATVQTGAGAAILLVEFLLDGVQIGADTIAPYSFSWIPTAANLGQHVLTARVTDTNSQVATTPPLTVNVANVVGSPPTVSVIATPIPGGFGLQTASTVNFQATAVATGAGSALTNVEIFLNDISVGLAAREQTTNIYRVAYDLSRFDFTAITPTINDITGAVTYPVRLYAIARDNNNNQTVSATTNLVINPSTSLAPSIQLQALTPTNITAGTQFFMAANINDLDGVVTTVQLYANGTLVGTFPNPQLGALLTYNANNAGRFNLYAVATDDTGNTAVSTPSIVINVTAVSAPVTNITRPADNATVTTVGAPVFLEGTAVNSATTQVPTLQFVATSAGGARQLINGIRVGTTTTYRANWTPTNPDTYTLTTQASVGIVQGTSTASRRVVVNNVAGLAPTITLTRSPGVNGFPGSASTASTADFAATATDPDGAVVSVEFFLDRNSIGQARRDPQGNTWRLTAAFAGLLPGAIEIVARATDSSGNVVASPTSTINVTAASSIAPSIAITPSTVNPAFNRAVQLRSNARDSDGTVNSVQYFANATPIATSTNAGSLFLSNWTPTLSGIYYLWALATDNNGTTTVAPTVEVTVRRNDPVLENSAFILQTYQDIANTTNINPLVFDQLDEQLASGALKRADIIVSPLTANGGVALTALAGFQAPVNLLATYYVLMGQWPTPQNYNTFLAAARNNLAGAVGNILSANEYFAKYGFVPTVALLNNPNGALPAQVFLDRLWVNAGSRPATSRETDLVRFMSNDVATPTIGRGYGPAGLNTAILEFVTNTNSTNTALFAKARAAALFYQLARPPVTATVEEITARIDALLKLPDSTAIANAVLNDIYYGYRFVTITKHPQALTVAPRSGAIFTVEAQGAPPLAYQWLLNGAPIANATNAFLSLTNVDVTRVGSYTVAITSSAAIATSSPATLTLSNTPTRLANISTRGVTTGDGANVLIGGFVVRGANANQTRQMLIRVVGPTLGAAPFNVAGVLANPRLEVYSGGSQTPVLTNDDWGSQTGGTAQVTAIRQAVQRAGAFDFTGVNSADATVLATLPPGAYTVQAKGPANNPNATGVVLIEVYDVTPGNAAGPKAANLSTRGVVGTGSNVLIAGFVVNGAVSRRILIRGAGPTLTRFNVPGVLADPIISLADQTTGTVLRTNDDWASGDDAGVIAQAATAAGAFPFANGSKDSAMIVMLAPGAYTVTLRGVNNGTGVGIVEVYDVDP